MVKINDVGISPATPIKQGHFREILKTHLKITKSILGRKPAWAEPYYLYIDMNAGPGIVDNEFGSPLIFCDEIHDFGLKYKAIFIEKNRINFEQLCRNIDLDGDISILNEDNQNVVPRYRNHNYKYKFGLIYNDPTGNIPDFDLLKQFSDVKYNNKIDILINCPCATIKRSRMCSKTKETRTLEKFIKPIKKKFWIIREAHYKHQWSMMIGTNWNAFPVFKSLGFHNKDSQEGKRLFDLFNYTKGERDDDE